MLTNRKAGIALIMLAIPALFYLLLRQGQNHYTLPRFYPQLDSVADQVLLVNKTGPDGVTIQDTAYHTIPDFNLINQDGKPMMGKSLKGKIHIADFFFTRCGTICPKLSSQLSRVQDIFRNIDQVKLVSYSVDPEHDRPEQLREYAKRYEAIPGKWTFLTGSKTDIYRLIQKAYFLPVVDAGVQDASPDETFSHSEKVVLVDKEGIIRGYYDGTDKEDVDRLVLETRVLLDEYKKQQLKK
jgi:protein SCO1